MKTVWIINQYGSLPSDGLGGRHRHLSRELAKAGYNVTLVASRWTHLTTNDAVSKDAPVMQKFEGFIFYRLPYIKYSHAHDKKRILNWFYFTWNILGIGRRLQQKPDIILYSSPSLIGYLSAYRLARKYKSKLIFEVRDIWPLTLTQLGALSHRHPFILFMQWIEDFAYKKSDFVISNLEGAIEHMKKRGLPAEKFAWLPNGYSEDELGNMEAADDKILRSTSYSSNFS